MFKKFAASALVAAVLFSGSLSAQAAEVLRVATNPTFPPFEFVNSETKEVTGFEMDLIRAMGKELGMEVKIMNIGFDGIIPALLAGTADVGASGFSITEERKKRVLFTKPFYQSGLTILTTKEGAEEIKGFEDLKGKTIAVQIGTTAAAKAKEIEGAKVTTFNNASEAIMDLSTGNSVAVINDRPVTDYILMQQPGLADKTVHLSDKMLSADDFAMVIPKSNPELCEKLDGAMQKLKDNGEYAKIWKKWFGDAK